jgi:hypothetical protein
MDVARGGAGYLKVLPQLVVLEHEMDRDVEGQLAALKDTAHEQEMALQRYVA